MMMADDIATSPANPHSGQVFNRPGGPDVYDGVPIVSQPHAGFTLFLRALFPHQSRYVKRMTTDFFMLCEEPVQHSRT